MSITLSSIFTQVHRDVPLHDGMNLLSFIYRSIRQTPLSYDWQAFMYKDSIQIILKSIGIQPATSPFKDMMAVQKWQSTATKEDIEKCLVHCIRYIKEEIKEEIDYSSTLPWIDKVYKAS